MIFGLFVLATALSISLIAAFYSLMGLTAIFAAAFWPIILMGSVLELGKIVTAVWLRQYWDRCSMAFKLYLVPALVVLMLITSMGIFGFLSKAHLQQTAAGEESQAQIQRLTSEIERQDAIVKRAEEKIKQLETTGTGGNAQVQNQIDIEQKRIDEAYKRVQPAIDEQNKIIEASAGIYKEELARIDKELATLQGYIDAGEIRKAQAMVGAAVDGNYGRRTAQRFREWQDKKRALRAEVLKKVETSINTPQATAAQAEIKRLRSRVEAEIAESNKLINKLRSQLQQTANIGDIQKQVDEQGARIKTANAEIDKLTKEKYDLQGQFRKLEAEVGPVRYVAALIYGDNPGQNLLERAVRWVIMALVFVFDPLAIVLILAGHQAIIWYRKDNGLPPIGGMGISKDATKKPSPTGGHDAEDLEKIEDLEEEIDLIHKELAETLKEEKELREELDKIVESLTKAHADSVSGYEEKMDELKDKIADLEREKFLLGAELDNRTEDLEKCMEENSANKQLISQIEKEVIPTTEEEDKKKDMIPPASHSNLTEEDKAKKQEEIKRKFRLTNDTEYEVRRKYMRKDQVLGK